jgi:hypothetical protein
VKGGHSTSTNNSSSTTNLCTCRYNHRCLASESFHTFTTVQACTYVPATCRIHRHQHRPGSISAHHLQPLLEIKSSILLHTDGPLSRLPSVMARRSSLLGCRKEKKQDWMHRPAEPVRASNMLQRTRSSRIRSSSKPLLDLV